MPKLTASNGHNQPSTMPNVITNPAKKRISPYPQDGREQRVAYVNLDRPPHERQRVWRACEACRKKKVKCNGEEPCQTCVGYKLECFYAENEFASRKFDIEYVSKLENRLDSMETMFREFMGKFPLGSMQMPTVEEHTERTDTRESIQDITGDDNEDGFSIKHHDRGSPVKEDDTMAITETCSTKGPLLSPDSEQRVAHADSFGELGMDDSGELRYLGLGSMTSIIEACVGLRRHIYSGLERKGYLPSESLLSSPESTHHFTAPEYESNIARHVPSAELVEFLIETFENDLYTLFPIVRGDDLRRAFHDVQLSVPQADVGSAAILFALLAVALPVAAYSRRRELELLITNASYKTAELHFYKAAKYFIDVPVSDHQRSTRRSWKTLTALGLLSMYLAETGSQADAWITVGRAVRIGQDLGFHVSNAKLSQVRSI